MAETPIVPPLRKPVSTYPTPTVGVVIYTEVVGRDDPVYKSNSPMKRGSLYSAMIGAKPEVIDLYPELYFLRERRYSSSDQLVIWDWATVPEAENSYNAEVNYVDNAVAYPAFTRVYTVRRDVYDQNPTLPIGNNLTALIGVRITSPGANYTQASGVIDGTDVDIQFVCAGGELKSGVIVNEGTGVTNSSEITIIGNGQDGVAVPITQPLGCVLTAQKKQELADDDPMKNEFVRVIRVYETLPGPWAVETRIDKDGAIVTKRTRRNLASDIVDKDIILNGEWIQTTHKEVDDFIAEEIEESRPIPGNPIVTTKIDEDGKTITTTKTLVDTTTVVTSETLVLGVWTRTYKEEVAATSFVKDSVASYKVSWQVSDARDIPGNPIPATELDKDGLEVDVVRTMKAATAITTQESMVGNVWTRTNAERITDLVSWEIVRARVVPGNGVPSATIDDRDHETALIETTLKEASTIVPGASDTGGGIIRKVEQREVTDLISEEVVTEKEFLDEAYFKVEIPNVIPEIFRALLQTNTESHVVVGTASEPTLGMGEFERSERQLTKLLMEERFTVLEDLGAIPITFTGLKETNQYKQVVTVTTTLELDTTVPTAPTATQDVEFRKLGNGLAVETIRTIPNVFAGVSAKNSRPNPIPEEFMGLTPIHTAEQTFAGGPSNDPPLSTGQLSIEEMQVTELTFRRILTSIPTTSMPLTLTSYEITDKFGGTVLRVVSTLDDAPLAVSTGLMVVASESRDLGNGLYLRVSKLASTDTEWPTLIGSRFDEEMQIDVPFEEQVVAAGYTPVYTDFQVEIVEPIDWQRSKRRKITKQPTAVDVATAITTYRYHPFRFPGYIYSATGGYYVRSSNSELCRHIVRTWWENTPTEPSITVDEIIMDNPIISNLNDTSQLQYAGPTLHDDLLTFGVLFFPATTPSFTEYYNNWIGAEKIIAASVQKTDIPNLWKIETISVVMR